MRTVVAAVLVSVLVSACAVNPEDDPVQIKLNDLEGRLQRIERANQSVVDMAQKLDATQSEIRSLRGRIDELQNTDEALKRQQRELYSDLDKRLTANTAGGAVGVWRVLAVFRAGRPARRGRLRPSRRRTPRRSMR